MGVDITMFIRGPMVLELFEDVEPMILQCHSTNGDRQCLQGSAHSPSVVRPTVYQFWPFEGFSKLLDPVLWLVFVAHARRGKGCIFFCTLPAPPPPMAMDPPCQCPPPSRKKKHAPPPSDFFTKSHMNCPFLPSFLSVTWCVSCLILHLAVLSQNLTIAVPQSR